MLYICFLGGNKMAFKWTLNEETIMICDFDDDKALKLTNEGYFHLTGYGRCEEYGYKRFDHIVFKPPKLFFKGLICFYENKDDKYATFSIRVFKEYKNEYNALINVLKENGVDVWVK